MAGETLESRFIIQDEASEVLENIARQSEIAGDALAELEDALRGIEATGEVSSNAATREGPGGGNNSSRQASQPMDEVPWDSYIEMADSANEVAAAFDEINQIVQDMPAATEEANNALEQCMAELERELGDTIDLSVLEEINARNEEAWSELLNEIEQSSEEVLGEWQDAERGIVEIPEEATEQAEETGQDLKNGVRGLGADIAGWWSIIKDAFGKIADAFGKLAEEADKLNTRIARFGLVAENEGKTGTARGERSAELYKQHQKYAQALGVQSEAFNETVLNMYSNGAGVVKSIEEAQAIAASSYMAMDIAGLRGRDKEAVMGEVQSMVNVGIADPDQIQEAMKIAPNILRTIEKQWEKNQNGKAFKLNNGEEITDATGKIAVLAQEGQITADLVAQAMVNSAEETNKTWQTLPSTWEKLKNRVGVIVENMTFDIVKKFGEIADDPQIATFVMSALNLGEKVVAFTQDYVLPVVGGAIRVIISALTTVFDALSDWQTAIPIIIAIGGGIASVAIKAGVLTKAITGVKTAIAAVAANPFILVAAALIAATLATAHYVRTTQEGQEAMLEVTAALSYAGQQLVALFTNIPEILKSAWRGVKSYFMSFVIWFAEKVQSLLEMAGKVSDTAKAMAEDVKGNIELLKKGKEAYDTETWKQIANGWGADFIKNKNFYDEYKKRIPQIAKENLTKNKDDLKLTGFLDDILKEMQKAPGTTKNPATVKGKVAIDGEYFDIIKRAAGVEIVNRYTTLRPTVNATFGDIHQVDAEDVIGQLGKQIQEAEGAAISDAQALGA